jgi:hypothetical protein
MPCFHAMPSLDIGSEVHSVKLENAVNQANKELAKSQEPWGDVPRITFHVAVNPSL